MISVTCSGVEIAEMCAATCARSSSVREFDAPAIRTTAAQWCACAAPTSSNLDWRSRSALILLASATESAWALVASTVACTKSFSFGTTYVTSVAAWSSRISRLFFRLSFATSFTSRDSCSMAASPFCSDVLRRQATCEGGAPRAHAFMNALLNRCNLGCRICASNVAEMRSYAFKKC